MKNIIISPKSTSKSAKYIAECLDLDYCNPYKEDKWNFHEYDKVINWGVSSHVGGNIVLNKPSAVDIAVDKLSTFYELSGHVRTVEVTRENYTAKNWAKLGHTVVGRKLTKGTCSKGVEFLEHGDNFLGYKFFSKYLPHEAEYRINAFKGKVVSIQEKIRRDKAGIFKFKLLYGEPTDPIKEMVEKVYERMGLDIFGLDVLADHDGNFNLLEVNSAPSIFGKTAERFVKLIGKELAK